MNYSNSSTRLCLPKPARTASADDASTVTMERDVRGLHLRVCRVATLAAHKLRRPLATFVVFIAALSAQAETYSFHANAPTLDKWVYPFASSGGGARTSGPTFGAIGNVGTFDDRDGQFFVGFNSTDTIPSGRGATSYLISSATLTLRLSFSVADMVVYDPTYDLRSTYDLSSGAPINGDDPGRPVELYGAGYRNGFTATSVLENTAYAPPGDPTAEGVRNIFATDFAVGARDVSNNIRDAFDPVPFAIGHVAPGDLNADGTMKGDIDLIFALNLLNPNVVSYLQSALDQGRVNLLATSLHQASQGGPATRPEFDAKELGLAGVPGRFELQVTVVPEPNTAGLLIAGASLFACWRNRRTILGQEEVS